MALFGTNGVRGKLDVLNPQLAFSLSAAFAGWCKGNGKICIAHDMRLTSPMLHAAAVSGALAAGKDVLDIGLASSPVAEFSLARQKCAGLIIVTASHNPPEWNALKFVDASGVAVSRERGEAIERIALAGANRGGPTGKAPRGNARPAASWENVGKVASLPNAASLHAAEVLGSVDSAKIRARRLRVALDFGNGTSALSRGVFEKLGCEIVSLNEKVDGTFPGRPSEPAEANVRLLCDAVRRECADFGVAWDGDSDRVVFVDEKGAWMVGDKGFAISAAQACRERKAQEGKLVVTTVATSRCVEEACAPLGAKTVYTAVGAPYLSEKMSELGARAVSGGEEVGGIIWPRFSLAKDGIFAAAKIAEMACSKPLSEYASELPAYFNSKTKVEVPSQPQKASALAAARKHAAGLHGRLNAIDGVRVDFADAWVIVRASGTEGYMRIFAEAKTKKGAESLTNEFKDVVAQAIRG